MFSYLHGIRSSNRRSAIPPPAASSQSSSRYYHETVDSHSNTASDSHLPPARHSQATFLEDPSPVSPDPPILPPIPRVSSQHENQISTETRIQPRRRDIALPTEQQQTVQQVIEQPPLPAPTGDSRTSIRVQDDPSNAFREAVLQQDPTPEQTKPPPSRRKRPIDLAYESMRSYTEPSRRLSFGNTLNNIPFHPPPQRNPPPPPTRLSNPELLPHPQIQTQPQPQPIREAPPPPYTARPHAPLIAYQKGHSKAKLNLLNPMSLLARRRSSQAVEEAYTQSQGLPGIQLPDPRIRGKVVHDFSAPRDRPLSSEAMADAAYDKDRLGRFAAKNRKPSPNRDLGMKGEDDSASSAEKEHAPIFKENFDDNTESWSSDMDSPAKRKSSAFVYQVALQASQAPEPSCLPAFARNLPSSVSRDIDGTRKLSTPPKAPLAALLEAPLPNQILAKPSPPVTPPKTRSPAGSISDPSLQGLGSPQRYKSNASRFSFDLAGVGSAAQEKILEDKHRQKAKQKESQSVPSYDNDVEYEDDDAYMGLSDMDDDGLEEKIPGINADDEENDIPPLQHAPDSFGFVSPNKSSFESITSHVSTSLTSPGTPRDAQGQVIALTGSKSSPTLPTSQQEERRNFEIDDMLRPKSTSGPISDAGLQAQPLPRDSTSLGDLAGVPRRYDVQDEDDMYFDDGMIEDFEAEDDQAFDESVFDDDTNGVYALTLRDQGLNSDGSILAPQSTIKQGFNSDAPKPSGDEDMANEMRDSIADLHNPALAPSSSQIAGLTHDNLGLHDRLALAANQAALEGKFERSYSRDDADESRDGLNSSLGTIMQKSQPGPLIDGFVDSQSMDEFNDFAFDESDAAFTGAEDDDPIIAAANAEALENDDDGFYGQEFGFFARKPGSGSSDVEFVNGGYFGSRAIESIHRMNSGRDNFQEPSLTPITERSEWSNRNSMISLAMHGYPLSAQYQSNPQLADLMRVQEGEELSLDSLKKLRRGAWGSSEVSLQSSSNSGMAAPLMMQTNSNNSLLSPSSQNMAGSFHSFSSNGQNSSNDSISSPSGDSPTVTFAMPQPVIAIPPMPMGPPPPPPIDVSSAKRSSVSGKSWAPGHSRNSSGAESVSYREENGRWYCERTRVIEETGEVEVLGRTVVEGGRI